MSGRYVQFVPDHYDLESGQVYKWNPKNLDINTIDYLISEGYHPEKFEVYYVLLERENINTWKVLYGDGGVGWVCESYIMNDTLVDNPKLDKMYKLSQLK